MGVTGFADLLQETADQHDHDERIAPKQDWWDLHTAYMSSRKQGDGPNEAAADAPRYMESEPGIRE